MKVNPLRSSTEEEAGGEGSLWLGFEEEERETLRERDGSTLVLIAVGMGGSTTKEAGGGTRERAGTIGWPGRMAMKEEWSTGGGEGAARMEAAMGKEPTGVCACQLKRAGGVALGESSMAGGVVWLSKGSNALWARFFWLFFLSRLGDLGGVVMEDDELCWIG
jgi:hypothetical protein